MKITAKYPGTCPTCSGRFDAGATVNWAKGRKATHVVCPELGMVEMVDHALHTMSDEGVPHRVRGVSRREQPETDPDDVQAVLAEVARRSGGDPGAEEHAINAMMARERRRAW